MAPRGRPKKRGNTRMDVAVDAMSELGFSPTVVREAVKRLLEVYGGDDYWVFIERDSYKVLIDFILDNHEDGGGTRAIEEETESPRPSHGWICADDEDHDFEDLLRLSPEPLSTALPKMLNQTALKP